MSDTIKKVKLDCHIIQIRGVSYKPEDVCETLSNDSVILLRANNIKDGKINFDDVVYVNRLKVKSKQFLKRGDILICTSSGSKELVGKAAYITADYDVVFGAFCKVLRSIDINAKYLGHYFQSDYYKGQIMKSCQGANINNLRAEHFNELLIRLPLMAEEQKAIAEKLDKVVVLIEKRKKQIEKLDELVKSRFIEMFGDCEIKEDKWFVALLSELCCVSSSKRIYQSDLVEEGIPFLRVADLVKKIETNELKSDLFISNTKYETFKENKLVPCSGDILVTSRGTLGKCYIVKTEDEFYFQDGMISWLSNIDKRINSVFLIWLFKTRYIGKQIENMQAGSTVAYLSISMLKKLQIPVPPIELQNKFAEFVEKVEKSKSAIKKSLSSLETLKKSLMQKYFG